MKKIIVFGLLVLGFLTRTVKADEGMWLPHLLGEQVYADMVKKGLKLTKEQLYSINKSSIKDAIIIFGGGCTGEIVSKEGLIFTNHHCGYDAIAAASSVEHNYLKEGFWAKTKQEEIYAKGVHAQFLVKIEDVTAQVNEAIKTIKPEELNAKLTGILAELANKMVLNTGYEGRIGSFFKGNQFLLFTYLRYKDVRLVGTPPESIGKFGGDTDNWEWPRHTGDFSIFRVYMSKEGKPAEYAADNIPYNAKSFLPVSVKGLKDGDYTMIFGYPGGTNRYETSYGVKLKTDIENPNLVALRDVRLKHMFNEMKNDPAVKIQLAGNYAYVANYWKFFDGESKQLLKYKVYEQKQQQEAAFLTWAKGKSEYETIFSELEKVYASWQPYAKHRVYINEGILGSPVLAMAAGLKGLDNALSNATAKPTDVTTAIDGAKAQYEKFFKSENIASDRNIVASVLQMFYKNVDATQQPKNFFNDLKAGYGDLNSDVTYTNFSKALFENSILLNEAKWKAFIEKPDTAVLHKDIAYKTATAFTTNYSNYGKLYQEFTAKNFALNSKYLKGILEMNNKTKLYPDANFTMRVSYGNVKSYEPRDAVKYSHICTLNGILEKYKPGDYEFDVPSKLLELAKNKDYGQYVDKSAGDIVVSFITTNDITGGNSGSPVLNNKGELVGLAYDGNYEALSHKIAFDKNLNRTICLDVRYLLFVVEKLGGATNIIQELDIRKI
ncbi:MAG: S46 family peptidase [Sediminibacterium sp.]|nr:S46 family peptidase [Sediminibacterium sp.]